MIQPETFDHGNPIFIQPGEHERSRWVPNDRGPKVNSPGYSTRYGTRACSAVACPGRAGYEDSPLCEDCSWKLYVKLEKSQEYEAKRETAKAEYEEWEFQERCKEELATLARNERWRNFTVKTPGWIYYLHIGDLVKIGFTSDLYQRRKQYPPNSKLLAVHPGTLKTEKQMHSKFFNSLTKGREWFTPTPDLIAHIEQARSQFKRDDLDTMPN